MGEQDGDKGKKTINAKGKTPKNGSEEKTSGRAAAQKAKAQQVE